MSELGVASEDLPSSTVRVLVQENTTTENIQ